MQLIETLKTLLADPEAKVDPDWTDAMAVEYPYMPLPAILELKRNGADIPPERHRMLLTRAAMTTSQPAVLHTIARPGAVDTLHFYPPEPQPESMTTDQVIDTFINRYGPADAGSEEAVLEKLIFNPTPDYSSLLEAEEERSLPSEDDAQGGGQDALINAFILKSRHHKGQSNFPSPSDPIAPEQPPVLPVDPEAPPVAAPAERTDESLLSESLAKIFIKRGQYKRAHEIISTLYLKYPQKSVYFADQLRFLQKLIINQQYLNTKTTK